MKITILDDYFDTVRTLLCVSTSWPATRSWFGTTTFRTTTPSPSAWADSEVLVLIRERTQSSGAD